jgi:hypothetical protein
MTDVQPIARVGRPLALPEETIPEELRLGRRERTRYRLALAGAILLAFAVRGYHVLSQDFPLNDGGLFYAMARDLQDAGYRLPAYTSYNFAGIPFGYSPLGFYLAAALDDLTPLSLADALRWLPLLGSCLIVLAFTALARSLLASRAAVVAAVIAFALVPRSFLWMIMGGGLTRSFGFFFALLTLHQLHRLYVRRDWTAAGWAGLTAGLTAASHLGTVPFMTFSSVLLWLAYGRHRVGTLGTAAAVAGSAVVSAPWWASVLAEHGPGPFFAAGATGGSIFRSLDFQSALGTLSHFGLGTSESVLSLIAMLGVVGFFYSLAGREWLLPAWWITIVVLDARQGSTFSTVPISLLAGVAVAQLLLPAMRLASSAVAPPTLRRSPGRHGWSPNAVLGCFAVFSTVTALLRMPNLTGGLPDLVGLSADEREALAWLREGTPESARILVVSGSPWEIDLHSEWLPVIGRRVSVATVQGYEWRPRGEFLAKKREYVELQGCAGWWVECVEDWARRTGQSYTHIYIPRRPNRDCCGQLQVSLANASGYERVYDGRGAVVYHRLRPLRLRRTTETAP